MADTTFVPHTTPVTADWLNDINDAVYHDLGGVGVLPSSSGSSKVGFSQGGTSSTTRTVQDKLREIEISIVDKGATTSATDNTTAIQATLDAVRDAGGGVVVIPPGTFKVLGQLVGYSKVSLKGVKMLSVIDTSLRTSYQADTLEPLIKYKGTKGSSVALTADVAVGATTITVASTAGFAVGDMIELTASSTGGFNDSSTTVQQGELFLITVVNSSTQLTLNRAVLDQAGYTVANSAVIAKVTPIENVSISGITLIGKGRDVSASGDVGIGVYYGRNVEISGNQFIGVDARSILLISNYNFKVSNNVLRFDPPGSNTQNNYGIAYGCASIYGEINGNYAVNMRHGIVSTHLSTALTEKYPGINREISIHHNFIVNAWHAGIATHNDVQYVSVENNTIDSSVFGVNLRDRDAYAIGNKISQCSSAGLYLSANPQRQVWKNNTVVNCPNGLTMSSITTGHTMNNISVEGNTILGVTSGGITFVDTTNAGPFRNINVTDNTIAEVTAGVGGNAAAIRLNGAFSGVTSRNKIHNVTNLTGIVIDAAAKYVELRANRITNVSTTALSITAGATGIVATDNYYKGYTTGISGVVNLAVNRNNDDGGSTAI